MKYLLCLVLLTGCGSLDAAYVKQDRANYETLAPRVRELLDKTDIFPADEEDDIRDRLNGWDARSANGVKALGDQ